jgi:tRNA A37 threonylcarbamoyladenosine synthetase subunit TsaC/SUA5/YrdC
LENITDIKKARQKIIDGASLAYPTEATYSFGCYLFNNLSVKRFIRKIKKGLILLIPCWYQLIELVADEVEIYKSKIADTLTINVPWIFPRLDKVTNFVSDEQNSIAIWMAAHKISKKLCYNIPIISTSANISK